MRLADHDALMQRDFAAWRARIGSRHPELRAALSSLTGFAEFRFDSFLDVRMPRWHSGRIVLIGDAAHATNPQLGMGANMALMDAATLAAHLQMRDGRQIAAALSAYQRAREPQLRFYAKASRVVALLGNPDLRLARAAQHVLAGVARNVTFVRRSLLQAICGYSHQVDRSSLSGHG